ncbi:MAG: TIGR00730 family Rossman fold protein [Alphaproteobacteria bacterium]
MAFKLCVYCASSSNIDKKYKGLTADVGTFCARQEYEIVYGGGNVGLMGILAETALEAKGRVIGVMPQILIDKEVAHQGLSELHITDDMQSRQAKMADLADAFLVLPGGLGTLAEFFEVITWKQLGLHDKPIYILNTHGYWDALLQQICYTYDSGFLRQEPDSLFTVVTDISQVVPI